MPLPLPSFDPPLRIALVEPDIAGNTGNIARLCAATGSELHLVEPLGFTLSDAKLRRAGLDYWDAVSMTRHRCYEAFEDAMQGRRMLLFSTKAEQSYLDAAYRPGDVIVFGSETRGLGDELLSKAPERVFGIPMAPQGVRSLNVANAASVITYEALRQIAAAE